MLALIPLVITAIVLRMLPDKVPMHHNVCYVLQAIGLMLAYLFISLIIMLIYSYRVYQSQVK